MKGLGTDEKALMAILCHRSNGQRVLISQAYKSGYGKVKIESHQIVLVLTSFSCRIWSQNWRANWAVISKGLWSPFVCLQPILWQERCTKPWPDWGRTTKPWLKYSAVARIRRYEKWTLPIYAVNIQVDLSVTVKFYVKNEVRIGHLIWFSIHGFTAYGHSMEKDIIGDTSGTFKMMLVSLAQVHLKKHFPMINIDGFQFFTGWKRWKWVGIGWT